LPHSAPNIVARSEDRVLASYNKEKSMTPRAPLHSKVLSDRMEITCGHLYSTYERFWQYDDLGRLVPSFLILMHQIVRASVPLMETARAICDGSTDDPVCRTFGAYLTAHIEEERHHDIWLLEDLEAAGFPRADVLGRIPSPSVASLVGAQYYWIQHHHPVALLGYMRLLEGNPPSESHVRKLQLRSGLPEALFRTYRLHGVLDPNHGQDLDSLCDSLPLSDSHELLIWISASHCASVLARCLDELERHAANR
jgi:hypothetical protein